ncbi:hypothetical protein AAVH_31761, partial [Aphelenchoides avenae]
IAKNQVEDYAIGLYNPTRCSNSDPSCRWQWIDGSYATYTRWERGYPADFFHADCAFMVANQIEGYSLWTNEFCLSY